MQFGTGMRSLAYICSLDIQSWEIGSLITGRLKKPGMFHMMVHAAISRYIIDSLCRNIGEGLYEMCCALPIDVKILQKDATIPYKYIIYSARRGEQGKQRKPHEWLHGADSRGSHVVNRCLRIPKEKVRKGGIVCIHSLIRTECNLFVSSIFKVTTINMTTWYIQKQKQNQKQLSKGSSVGFHS